MKHLCMAFIIAALITACDTTGKVAPLDPQTGRLSSSVLVGEAKVVVDKNIPLAAYKTFVVVLPDVYNQGLDESAQLRAIGYFNEVVGFGDLKKFVSDHNLQGKVGPFDTWNGLSSLYRAYKPFLVIRFDCVEKGNIYHRLIVTNPQTMENVFVGQVKAWSEAGYNAAGLLTLGAGMYESNRCSGTDEKVRYPLFNALIKWIDQNR